MKKLRVLIVVFIISLCGAGGYTMTQSNIEELIVCASNERASYIPAVVCKIYLFRFRANADDIRFMQQRTGLNFLTNLEDPQIREQLFSLFINKGMDINTLSRIDGLAPLHAAVLLNDASLVRFLLQHGANRQLRERTNGFTPLEYLVQLDKQLPGIDRQPVKQQLSQTQTQ